MNKKIAIWVVVGLVVVGGIFALGKSGGLVVVADVVTEADQIKGNASAKVVLMEYSDFQCPACASYFPVVSQLEEELGDDIAIVYRHLPLKQHLHAELAAIVSEAAGRQGKFWEMHDIIFTNQDQWSSKSDAASDFANYAQIIGLDLGVFADDLKSEELKDKVREDYRKGIKMGVNSTPTFFLNGEKLKNPQNYEEFKFIIEQAINQNG